MSQPLLQPPPREQWTAEMHYRYWERIGLCADSGVDDETAEALALADAMEARGL